MSGKDGGDEERGKKTNKRSESEKRRGNDLKKGKKERS